MLFLHGMHEAVAQLCFQVLAFVWSKLETFILHMLHFFLYIDLIQQSIPFQLIKISNYNTIFDSTTQST